MQALVLTMSPVPDIHHAAKLLYLWVEKLKDPKEALCVKIILNKLDTERFFSASSGLMRAYFRSRDQDLELGGLGVAHKRSLSNQKHRLNPDQFYMGGMSFDSRGALAPEWQGFGQELFFLPLLQIIKRQNNIALMLNYEPDYNKPFLAWRDHALSVLKSQSEPCDLLDHSFGCTHKFEEPSFDRYAQIIGSAKALINYRQDCRKVVLGRRNTHIFSHAVDPVRLFFRLSNKSHKGFSFLLDAGLGGVFFGVSPELLYRRLGRHFETESLAGTRVRSSDEKEDERLKQELINSCKDQVEHALVCEHIEKILKEFGATRLFTSRLEVMSLPFVQHLVRRYHGNIRVGLSDDQIIKALHPTPAVCGLDRRWALDFIREHEGFDRGFYAGPVGYVGHDTAEFAVAIRSAIYYQQQLYVYAAGGIVAESEAAQEWDELTNKQKNITSILE